jgi:LytS/YehU family sensor histidine kinase
VASPKAPEMLIKLADLLSYMLYECDAPQVKLEKVIGMIREYIELEKIRQGKRLELTFQVNGDLGDQMITPLLLLPFIDNSFSYSNNELVEQAWLNVDITIDDNNLSMKLINGRPSGMNDDTDNDEQALANVRKRLYLLYPGRYDLKISAEQELLMVYLHLTLEEQTQETNSILQITKPALSYAGV